MGFTSCIFYFRPREASISNGPEFCIKNSSIASIGDKLNAMERLDANCDKTPCSKGDEPMLKSGWIVFLALVSTFSLSSCRIPINRYALTPATPGQYELDKTLQGRHPDFTSFIRGALELRNANGEKTTVLLDNFDLSIKYATQQEYESGKEYVVKTIESPDSSWIGSKVDHYRELKIADAKAGEYEIKNFHAKLDEVTDWADMANNRARGFQRYFLTFEINGEQYGGENTFGYFEFRNHTRIELGINGESLNTDNQMTCYIQCYLDRLYRYDENNEPIIVDNSHSNS